MERKRAAVYCRAEGAGREREPDTERQRQDAMILAAQRRLDVVAVYEDFDSGGWGLDRPGVRRLLEDAEQGDFDYVLMSDASRLAGNTFFPLENARAFFHRRGLQLITAQSGTKPDGKADGFPIAHGCGPYRMKQ